MDPFSRNFLLILWILLLLTATTNKNIEIGWDLPGCHPDVPGGHCHPPTAPNLPRIPNSTGVIIQPTTCSEASDTKYTYGCCALPPPPPGELVTQELAFSAPTFDQTKWQLKNLEKPEYWARSAQGSIPAGAIVGGEEADGEPLYVVRAEYNGSLTPGKLSRHGCHIPWGAAERNVPTYEVLCNVNGDWVPTERDKIPENALKAGHSEDGETLYIGRAKHKGHWTPGKVQPSHSVCYVSYGGKEISYAAYEVFVVKE